MKTLQERLIWARGLKAERDRTEFTQQDLANKAGVSQGNIAHLESGRTKTSRNLVSIAEALGVQPTWLAEGKGHPFPPGIDDRWALEATGSRPAARPTAGAPEAASPSSNLPEESARSLIWADSEDLLLLTLFHGTDSDGREKILRTAHRVPKIMQRGAIRNQS